MFKHMVPFIFFLSALSVVRDIAFTGGIDSARGMYVLCTNTLICLRV